MNFPLGRIQNHDPRSLDYRAGGVVTHYPVKHRIYGQVLDQGNLHSQGIHVPGDPDALGSCVLNAASHALNAVPIHVPHSHLVTEWQAINWYTETTASDPYAGQWPPDDTGTDANSAAKVLRSHGRISGWTHCFGLDHFLAALQLSPVLIGITWDESMFEVDSKGYVHPDGNAAGGHETLVFADDAKGTVTVRNSWGRSWGLHGNYKMTYADLDAKLRDGGDATVLMPVGK